MNNINDFTNYSNNDDMERLRDLLVNEPWDKIKNNSEILTKALISDGINVNVGDALLMERVLLLADIFENPSVLLNKDAIEVLYIFSDTNIDEAERQRQIQEVCPNLQIKQNIDMPTLQNKAGFLANGLNNIRNVALTKFAEELVQNVFIIKSMPLPKIEEYCAKTDTISQQLIKQFQADQEPTEKQLSEILDALKNLGRSTFQLQQIVSNENVGMLIDMFQKVKDALMVVKQAHTDNVVPRLDDIDVLRELVGKVKTANKT